MSVNRYGSDRTAEALVRLGWGAPSDFEDEAMNFEVALMNKNVDFYNAVTRRAAVESFIRERWSWIENLERLYGKNGLGRISQYRTQISFAEEHGYSYVKDPAGFWKTHGQRLEQRAQMRSPELNGVNLLMQAVVVAGNKTREGHLIEAVSLPWFAIVDLIRRDPEAMFQIDWRRWEEIIAGAYVQEGFEVVLTPRSNDRGRDVIATRKGFGSIRFFDQVKAYRPGHLVTAEEIRAMLGVLSLESNVSKGIVSTTSSFAPGVRRDPQIERLIPYRLELKAQEQLLEWLTSIAKKRNQGELNH